MRPRTLSLALLALLVAACGAPVTVRVPLRIRLGGPTAAPPPTVIVVLPKTAMSIVASPTAAASAVEPRQRGDRGDAASCAHDEPDVASFTIAHR